MTKLTIFMILEMIFSFLYIVKLLFNISVAYWIYHLYHDHDHDHDHDHGHHRDLNHDHDHDENHIILNTNNFQESSKR